MPELWRFFFSSSLSLHRSHVSPGRRHAMQVVSHDLVLGSNIFRVFFLATISLCVCNVRWFGEEKDIWTVVAIMQQFVGSVGCGSLLKLFISSCLPCICWALLAKLGQTFHFIRSEIYAKNAKNEQTKFPSPETKTGRES